MLSPDYLLHISEGAEAIAEELHSEIIRKVVNRVMLRLGRGEDYLLTSVDKWQIERLQEAGYLLEDIQAEIAKYTKIEQAEIAEAMEDAGVKALSYDDKIYQQVGLSPVPLWESPHLIRLMQRNYESTMGEWSNFTGTMASEVQKTFINELDRAYNLVSTGAMSYTEAVKEVVNNLISESANVMYDTGHIDSIETATLRAVRTGISQATAQIQIERMNEMDVDLVIVSSHLGARPDHQTWQGKVYSRSGKTSKYDDFRASTGYGSVDGLCGCNCRHSFSPFFEGMDNPFEQYDSEENKAQYEKEQYQRTLERRIRKTKRECIGLKESVDSCVDEKEKFNRTLEYQRKARLLSVQNKAYKEYCERNNLKPLADRIQIAQWDRKQAAMARAAARKNNVNSKPDLSFMDKKELIYKNENEIDRLQTRKKDAEMKFIMASNSQEMQAAQQESAEISIQIEKLKSKNDKLQKSLGLPTNAKERFYDQKLDYSDLPQDIRETEYGAIGSWTRTGYTSINRYKRFDDRGVNPDYIREAEELKKMIDRNVVSKPFAVKRGTDFAAMNSLFGSDSWKNKGYNVSGKVISDRGFLATTPDIHGGFGGNVQMYIDVPKGAKGVYIGDLSAAPDEKEFLLQCGTKLKVEKIEIRTDKWGDALYDVYLKVVID